MAPVPVPVTVPLPPVSQQPRPVPEPEKTLPPEPLVPVVVPKQPDIRWYPRGIGHPLVSDDERARGKKVVLLTFDDGPTAHVTPLILDVLKQEQIKALFFVTGYGARNREILARIHKEGHQIGTHTQNHELLTNLTREEMRAVIEPVNQLVKEITGERPRYFRPPHGSYNDVVLGVLKELNMELINWSNGSLDWHQVDANGFKSPATIVEDVMRQLHPGAVILFHDTLKHTAEALPEVIKQIRAAGYEFVVLP